MPASPLSRSPLLLKSLNTAPLIEPGDSSGKLLPVLTPAAGRPMLTMLLLLASGFDAVPAAYVLPGYAPDNSEPRSSRHD